MLITCPACRVNHDVDDRLIPENATKVRCKSCDHRFDLNFPRSVREAPRVRIARPEPERPAPKFAPRPSAPVAEPTRARKIGVLISKGGVGKTTTAVNLAAGLAMAGKKVLIADTDTQGQASYALGIEAKRGLADLVNEDCSPEEAVVQARENLWCLAGGKSLAGVKRLIDRKDFAGEMTLAEALAPYGNLYDYVIIDSSPGWDPLTVNVLFYVREVLAPVSLEVMPLQGLKEFLRGLSAISRYNPNIELKYILPTFLDKRVKHPGDILGKLGELYPEYMCQPVRYNVRLSEAPAFGQTIFEFAPDSNGAEDYRELVRKVTGDGSLFKN